MVFACLSLTRCAPWRGAEVLGRVYAPAIADGAARSGRAGAGALHRPAPARPCRAAHNMCAIGAPLERGGAVWAGGGGHVPPARLHPPCPRRRCRGRGGAVWAGEGGACSTGPPSPALSAPLRPRSGRCGRGGRARAMFHRPVPARPCRTAHIMWAVGPPLTCVRGADGAGMFHRPAPSAPRAFVGLGRPIHPGRLVWATMDDAGS